MNEQTNPSHDVDALLGQIGDEILEQMALGKEPDIEIYAQRHPDLAPLIRTCFPALELVGNSNSSDDAGIDLTSTRQLGDFQILRELGAGGMGFVYEAEQLSMGRRVALKVLPMAGAMQPRSLQRFHNEVRAAASLDHPRIVSVYSAGEDRGVHFYAMQLVRGQSLAEVIGELTRIACDESSSLTGDSISQILAEPDQSISASSVDAPTEAFTPSDTADNALNLTKEAIHRNSLTQTAGDIAFFQSAARLGVQAADALQHAHDQGVLHRDIKPGNLLLDADAQLFVADFGLARIETEGGMTMTGDLVGTLRYMSPEQALAKRVVIDQRSDIYSLGMTLYELLTLQAAFDASDRQELLKQIAFHEPRKPRHVNRAIPQELETIVLRALEKNPEDRYSTAADLRDDLQAYLDTRPIMAKPPTIAKRISKWAQRHRTAVSTAVVTIVAAFILSGGLLWAERGRTLEALADETDERARAERNEAIAKEKQAEAERNLRLANKNLKLARNNLNFGIDTVDQMYLKVAQHWVADDVASSQVQIEFLRKAAEFYQRTIDEASTYNLSAERVATCYDRLGHVHAELGEDTTARKQTQQSLVYFRQALNEQPQNVELLRKMANGHEYMAALQRDAGDYGAAENEYRLARTYFKAIADKKGSSDNTARFGQARIGVRLAEVHFGQNRLKDAKKEITTARSIYRATGPKKLPELDELESGSKNPKKTDQLMRGFALEAMNWTLLQGLGEFANFLRCEWLFARVHRLEGDHKRANFLLDTWISQIDRIKSSSPNREVLLLEVQLLEEKAQSLMGEGKFADADKILRQVLTKRVKLLRGKRNPVDCVTGPGRNRSWMQPHAFCDFAMSELRLSRCLREQGRPDEALTIAGTTYWMLLHLGLEVKRPEIEVARRNALAEIALTIQDRWPDKARVAAQHAGQLWYGESQRNSAAASYVSGLFGTKPDMQWFLARFPEHDFTKKGVEAVGKQRVTLPAIARTSRVLRYARAVKRFRKRLKDPEESKKRGYGGLSGDLRQIIKYAGGADAYTYFYLAMTSFKSGNPGPARDAFKQGEGWIKRHGPPSRELAALRDEAAQMLDPKTRTSQTPRSDFVAAGAGGLSRPRGIAFGPDHNRDGHPDHLYVVSADTHQILRFDAGTGKFIDVFVGDDPNTPENEAAGMKEPARVVFGPDGHLYVLASVGDETSRSVLRFNGRTGKALPGPRGEEGTAVFVPVASSGSGNCTDIAFSDQDGDGYEELFVLCSSAPDAAATVSRHWGPIPPAGKTPGEFVAVYAGDDPKTEQDEAGGLERPHSIAFGPDANGDQIPELFVTNRAGNNVLRFDGRSGKPFPGSHGKKKTAEFVRTGQGMENPQGIVIHQGTIYISTLRRIHRFDAKSGNLIDSFESGAGWGMALGPAGKLYVGGSNVGNFVKRILLKEARR